MERPTEDRLQRAWEQVRQELLNRRGTNGCWTGSLSASALSTATAVMALEQMKRHAAVPNTVTPLPSQSPGSLPPSPQRISWEKLIDGGLEWLLRHQNSDGGWGDTVKSLSNISTTLLVQGAFLATRGDSVRQAAFFQRSEVYAQSADSIPGMVARYGTDKTFSVPILTHCALAGMVPWSDVPALPFELACVPARFYAAMQLPVVSYALPALIAIGQARHHFQRPANSLYAGLRDLCIPPSLRVLARIQPALGGFLEATPLTSFVTMSLAAKGLADHPVAVRGSQFIVASVLPDGSWPIDTNLATWVTTLSVNALRGSLPAEERERVRDWLLAQQFQTIHPYTQSAPGGWAWTDLAGGVPDADDTPGAILALWNLIDGDLDEPTARAIQRGAFWLRGLQNRDGGWPTFCRGWGTLPFDRSSCDITAHCIRALHRTDQQLPLGHWVRHSVSSGFRYLAKQQRPDGSWLPLWFGNQHAPDDTNPVYGTSKVLLAYRETGQGKCPESQSGLNWLRQAQNSDGGWGGQNGCPSSVEETSLALEALLGDDRSGDAVAAGLKWLVQALEEGRVFEPAPIGFYFAKLWYFEDLYPLIFAAAALHRAAGRIDVVV